MIDDASVSISWYNYTWRDNTNICDGISFSGGFDDVELVLSTSGLALPGVKYVLISCSLPTLIHICQKAMEFYTQHTKYRFE